MWLTPKGLSLGCVPALSEGERMHTEESQEECKTLAHSCLRASLVGKTFVSYRGHDVLAFIFLALERQVFDMLGPEAPATNDPTAVPAWQAPRRCLSWDRSHSPR